MTADRRIIEPDPDVAAIVRQLFELYATGRWSIRKLARWAREQGLVSRKRRAPVPQAAIHAILRSRIYTGSFEWDGLTYKGTHQPLISVDLWERAQAILSQRFAKRTRGSKHEFAFSGLISCGHCGCALVGEIKKGRYTYYHCTGAKGKCPERYTRQEMLEERFTALLKGLTFDMEIMEWVAEALRQSHQDEQREHEEVIARLRAEHDRLQNRLDIMYGDRLDGRIDLEFYERKAAEWRAEQRRLLRSIEEHQNANEGYIEDGIKLLELARRAHLLFQEQLPREKRRLLDFVVSNCTWKNGELLATYRQPFDLLAESVARDRELVGAYTAKAERCLVWLPGQGSNLRHPD